MVCLTSHQKWFEFCMNVEVYLKAEASKTPDYVKRYRVTSAYHNDDHN